jgi:hypothetical protein
MDRHLIKIKETFASVICDEEYIPIAEAEIIRQRKFIEDYIIQHPDFRTTLEPFSVEDEAPDIIKSMSDSTSKVGVGPMASVAGAIAHYTLKAVLNAGATHAIIENGGDIAMFIKEPSIVGIFTGSSKINNIGFRFMPSNKIIGICTSSGTIGHSLSFGKADAATVIGDDAIIADAVATALGNSIMTNDSQQITESMEKLLINGIQGMLTIIGDTIGVCGDLPEIIKVNNDIKKISKG